VENLENELLTIEIRNKDNADVKRLLELVGDLRLEIKDLNAALDDAA
jgi:hypothetical protein